MKHILVAWLWLIRGRNETCLLKNVLKVNLNSNIIVGNGIHICKPGPPPFARSTIIVISSHDSTKFAC